MLDDGIMLSRAEPSRAEPSRAEPSRAAWLVSARRPCRPASRTEPPGGRRSRSRRSRFPSRSAARLRGCLLCLALLAAALSAGAQAQGRVFWGFEGGGTAGVGVKAEDEGTLGYDLSYTQMPSTDLTVRYTIGGTATGGADYTLPPGADYEAGTGTFTIPAGTPAFTPVPFPVTIVADQVADSGETIVIAVTDTDDYDLGAPATLTVTVVEDTGSAAFAITGEPAVGETLTVERTASDPDGDGDGGVSYRWFAADTNTNQSGIRFDDFAPYKLWASTQTLGDGLLGKYIYVLVLYTDGNGLLERVRTDSLGPIILERPPLAPPWLVVVSTPGSSTSLDARWGAPGNEGRPPITGYDLDHVPFGPNDGWVEARRDVPGTRASIAGLAADAGHIVRVRARNAVGPGPWKQVNSHTNAPGNAAPAFPVEAVSRCVPDGHVADTPVGEPVPAAVDADGDAVTLTVSNLDANLFWFDPLTRQFHARPVAYDPAARHVIAVYAYDDNGGSDAVVVTVRGSCGDDDDDGDGGGSGEVVRIYHAEPVAEGAPLR
ncbi:MAG: hypothetical protein F4171_00320, partial [Gammaproteobacteria bacterium]|nr:hypothetical protein [Gammaproteobacteria bacterium]